MHACPVLSFFYIRHRHILLHCFLEDLAGFWFCKCHIVCTWVQTICAREDRASEDFCSVKVLRCGSLLRSCFRRERFLHRVLGSSEQESWFWIPDVLCFHSFSPCIHSSFLWLLNPIPDMCHKILCKIYGVTNVVTTVQTGCKPFYFMNSRSIPKRSSKWGESIQESEALKTPGCHNVFSNVVNCFFADS